MFDYTQAIAKKTLLDLKRLVFFISLATQILLIAYFVYAIFAGSGNLVANAILTVLSVSYFIFFIATRNVTGKEEKRAKKITYKVFKYTKLFIKTMTLVGVLYGAAIAAQNVTVVDIVLIALSLIGWIMQVLFEVVAHYIVGQWDLLVYGIKMDIEPIVKPVAAVSGAIKKLSGKPQEEPEPTEEKKREKLNKLKEFFKSESRLSKKEKTKISPIEKEKSKDGEKETANK